MEDEPRSSQSPTILTALAVLAAAGAVLRVALPALGFDLTDRVDSTTLQYLVVAGILLLLPRVRTLSYGNLKVELDQLQAEMQKVRQDAAVAVNAAAHGVGGKPPSPVDEDRKAGVAEGAASVGPADAAPASGERRPIDPGDPQRGQWGGRPERNGRSLSAIVKPSPSHPTLFLVRLVVRPTDPARPLVGSIIFHLHPTFRPDIQNVPVTAGAAMLDLVAWGAFTVGAVADEGKTTLELDLAGPEVAAPPEFQAR